ncbi:hypothetical protein AAG906_016873 [Vitis piasezkii]
MTFLSWLLMWFEAISGLRINLDKMGALPSTYLGLSLGAPHKSMAVWDGVEERIRKRLALWKRKEGSLMFKNIAFLVGDGRRVRFWKDNWCGNKTLCDFFPSLYALVDSKDAWVADCWDSLGKKGDGIPGSLDLSMIGRWRRWRIQRMGIFLLNPFIVRLNIEVQSRFRGTSFGVLVFLLRWVSLLGKLHGERS